MTTACVLPTVDNLAAHLLKKFRPGLLRLAARAGWQSGDLQGVAWLAAHDALQHYDGSKGNLDARGWWCCRAQARGFLPAGGREEAFLEAEDGDDPASILEAAEQVDLRLLGLGAGVERKSGSARSARRFRARARSAAAQLLRGGDGRQGELF
ncbi:MAG: hypothetical protein AB1544_05750 [Pseudomonadota bacterium]|jgi:hypothetical protein